MIFVPIIEMIVFRHKPQKKIVLAVTMSFIGILLLALKDDFSVNMENLRGDLLCLLGAVAYAVDLILTERAASTRRCGRFSAGRIPVRRDRRVYACLVLFYLNSPICLPTEEFSPV